MPGQGMTEAQVRRAIQKGLQPILDRLEVLADELRDDR
jgi:hypothetical protein